MKAPPIGEISKAIYDGYRIAVHDKFFPVVPLRPMHMAYSDLLLVFGKTTITSIPPGEGGLDLVFYDESHPITYRKPLRPIQRSTLEELRDEAEDAIERTRGVIK